MSRREVGLRRTGHYGQSLKEYVLVGVLIAISALAALMLLGKNFNKQLVFLSQDAKTHVNAAALASSLQSRGVYAYTIEMPGPDGKPVSKTFQVRTIPPLAGTTGANGSQMGSTRNALPPELIAALGLSSEQANAIIALSNQAHKMAAIQQIIETAVRESDGSTERFLAASITFDGSNYASVWELSNILASGGEEWVQFESMLDRIENDGTLDNPTVEAFVDNQVSSISNSIGQMRRLLYQTNLNGNSGSRSLVSLLGLNASQLTHLNAANLCSINEEGNDTGTRCSLRSRRRQR